ncbi:hypothetical protein NCCNTM_04920 [Mycolicibacterium sp. NCC-Tsukiji]|uniref:DoxX family protein n=1 Tax=Mycolicibacterium mucogenicum TaxID=56689 RepID=A0A1A0MSF1_MYCMU|nr:hypothetical protein A5642_17180 [Mycolicibacterium mucogenicum]GCA96857.1 hypothetical protein NCCNTM_04920 [Mycolicibacterium sp. NCC-Tsukiji]
MAVALLLHGADHMRRGMNVIPPAVMVGGTLQLILAAVTIVLVFRRNRWAPLAAVGIGYAGAVGFTAAHLLPKWGFFSDSFINAPPWARVTAFSWVTAILEIAANLIFGTIGLVTLKARTAASSAI